MSQRICNFHNTPGGCRRGAQCKFQHTRSSSSSPASSSRPQQQARSPPSTPPTNTPPGVCSFYWTSGKCRREFDCRFRHTAGPTVAQPRGVGDQSAVNSRPSAATLLPFLTEAGLAKVTGTGTDIFSSLSPSANLTPNQVHNHLKRFFHDDYRFRTTLDVYAFLESLNSASSNNTSWSNEDGQLLLSSVAAENGLLRISDILQWDRISTRAGPDRVVLSFQRGIVPLLRYMSSDFVVKSTLGFLINALYMRIVENFDRFANMIEDCMKLIIVARSFKDPMSTAAREPVLGSQVLTSLTVIFYECLTRFKNMTATHPRIILLARNLREWLEAWLQGISATPPTFDDPFGAANMSAREFIAVQLRGKVNRVVAIVDREQGKIDRAARREGLNLISGPRGGLSEGIITALRNTYEGPGIDRADGPRHDNDFIEIERIRVAPTHEELISRIPPFLPANLYEAPHPLPRDSMERLLDIQFRLLREELTAPLRTSVRLVRDDLLAPPRVKTKLSDLVSKGGGKYRGHDEGQDGIMFNVYTNVQFASLVPDRRGISTGLTFDAPPGRARSPQSKARVAFWEGMSGKRLMQGGLIALVWKRGIDVTVHLGTLASSLRDLTDSVRRNADQVMVRVVFFDPSVELRILETLKRPQSDASSSKILVEAPVMFEAIRPFLEALRVEPESIPLRQYLVHRPAGFFNTAGSGIMPPAYALVPGFRYQLSSLFPPEAQVQDLRLNANDPTSIEFARQELKRHSRLDPSQADATVDVLIRALALIQGPPGTGKSFTGVELLRVLLANKIGPILMIAFTNHALDHMLCSVLDAQITTRIVRLGSRSADERMSQYSIEALEMVAGKSRLDRTFGRNHRTLRDIEDEIKNLMHKFLKTSVESDEIVQYLGLYYPEHHEDIYEAPPWIVAVKGSIDNMGWHVAGKKGQDKDTDKSMYAFWRRGQDLEFLLGTVEQTNVSSTGRRRDEEVSTSNRFDILADAVLPGDDSAPSELLGDSEDSESSADEDLLPEELWMQAQDTTHTEQQIQQQGPLELPSFPAQPTPSSLPRTLLSQKQPLQPSPSPTTQVVQISDLESPEEFFFSCGHDGIPAIPTSDRPLDELLDRGDMWAMALPERERLHTYWNEQVRLHAHDDQVEEFERLRNKHADAQRIYNEGKDETRRQLLRNMDIVGCTTTGAAKLTSLLKGLSPRVMLVEEAGQVLEAHVLGSLVPSIEHLILIGDPLQLRPTLNNYSLSMDSRRGAELYKFDMSLMERLAKSGLPMSRIDVQRRMRPTISDLIRNTLYPGLEDHDLVKSYPPVRGFVKNVFFLSHTHRENGGSEDTASKYNVYEVEMIKDLVLYLLRQGAYSQEGDIVVLCAYLGQLARVRDALASEVAVIIDGRDQVELADREADDENNHENTVSGVEHVKVSKRVRLRTVDNYQGEEAKIVILSLVRNSGSPEDDEDVLGRSSGARPSIGFLKSENRTNVALSRAKEGLFILGNAVNLASRSRMWRSVVDDLEGQAALGDAFPIACQNHPDTVEYISEPGKLPRLSPDGGCLRPCDSKLKCGHLCPHKCHPDDPKHVAVVCFQSCRRLCARGHPCNKQCADPCGDCQFPIYDVSLPCGHCKRFVPCHLMDTLEEVPCDEIVTKQLPTCEHTAQLRCSQDPKGYPCQAVCMGTMACCGRDCNSQCHQCQGTNIAADLSQPIRRTNHNNHRCQRTLYCEHSCQNPCTQNHECTQLCKEQCRQVCAHAQCNDYCSTPCAPCQEPCTWNCPHLTCPVPCGSICVRLPCDRRCEFSLKCGHRCPSVCGEDCSIQICPLCAPEEVKARVVDFIMQRTLEEIDSDQDTLDELLITVPTCRHVFTVETLDGHCDINAYYRRNGVDGSWLGLKTPPPDFKRPPACPTCRSSITSPRYGRVFKPANLGILENNVASQMSRSLNQARAMMDSASKSDIEASLIAATATVTAADNLPAPSRQCAKNRAQVLKETRDVPVAWDTINPESKKFHGIFPATAAAWRKVIQRLNRAYRQAIAVAETRSAHLNAWQAAFSCLYEQEMELALAYPSKAPRRPEEYAMRIAKLNVGQPQPRADRRYLVEAFWTTLQIRFTLADLARALLDGLRAKAGSYPERDCQSWATFITFLLRTTVRDAELAVDIARRSESHRQAIKSASFVMRAYLEQFRFNVDMSRRSKTFADIRDTLTTSAVQKANEAMEYQRTTLKIWRTATTGVTEQWLALKHEFHATATIIIEEYQNIEKSLRADTFYQPVSLEEKTEIVRALGFSHTGHFYNCPNGHTFVIGECGGAMQRALCPECGAAIGGANHHLEATNTRATELEALASQQGAERSPWNWGM